MSPTAPALLLIDLQKGMQGDFVSYVPKPLRLPPRNNPQAETNIAKLLKAWRTAGKTIVHIRHASKTPGSPFWPGQIGADFQTNFEPYPGEHVVEKSIPDALINGQLAAWLLERNIHCLALVGVSTNNSVEATARTGGNLGFTVYVVEDACFTFDKADIYGAMRPAQQVHAMSLANLQGEYAQVVVTLDALKLGLAA